MLDASGDYPKTLNMTTSLAGIMIQENFYSELNS